MRIAHITATFPPYQAGTGIVALHNAIELVKRGHEVHIYTAAVPSAPAEELLHGVRVHRLKPVLRVGNAPFIPALRAISGFDILHLHAPFMSGAELVRLAAWRNRIPLIMSYHNDLIGRGVRSYIFWLYQQISFNFTARYVDTLCAVSMDHYYSTALAAALKGREVRIMEIPNGVDIYTFCPTGDERVVRRQYGISEGVPLGLFVAALDQAHHMKGLDHLLEAILAARVNMHLLVVGDGNMRHIYQQQAYNLGLSETITFAGQVDNALMPDYYRAADFTVLPSSAESFGIVLIESMACGTPVISSNVPGVRTVVKSGVDGYHIDPWDIQDIANAIRRMITLPIEVRREMGMAGRRKVEEQYAWERIGQQLEVLYSEVLVGCRQLSKSTVEVST